MLNKINFFKILLYTIIIGISIGILKFLLAKVIDIPDTIYTAIVIGWIIFVVLTLNKFFLKK